jgi:hypothetical protein
MIRIVLAASLVGLVILHAGPRAAAQDYPTRPVRIVFPLAAGGGGDVFTRGLADELQKAWRQPVVVENRPGGALNIGTRASKPFDGYTICVMSVSLPSTTSSRSRPFPTIPRRICSRSNLFFNTPRWSPEPDQGQLSPRCWRWRAAARQAELRDVLVSRRSSGQAE